MAIRLRLKFFIIVESVISVLEMSTSWVIKNGLKEAHTCIWYLIVLRHRNGQIRYFDVLGY